MIPVNSLAVQAPGVGPAWYFSPERRRGDVFDHLDDVWAAGCMMAELVIGQGARCVCSEGMFFLGIDRDIMGISPTIVGCKCLPYDMMCVYKHIYSHVCAMYNDDD